MLSARGHGSRASNVAGQLRNVFSGAVFADDHVRGHADRSEIAFPGAWNVLHVRHSHKVAVAAVDGGVVAADIDVVEVAGLTSSTESTVA